MLEIVKQYTFRQFLIPRNNQTAFNPIRKVQQINPNILNAIGDNAQPITSPTYIDGIVNFYKRYKFIIRPDNFFLLGWDTIIILIVIFYIFQMGLLLCFQEQFWEFELNSALGVHIIFIMMLGLDIFISPFKAYYSDGLLVVDIQAIVRNYLKFQIFIDVIAVLAIIIPLASGSLASNWIKLFWIIKIYTVSKINIQFQRITQLNITYSTIYLCIKLAVVLIVYAHYLGIGFYLVSLWVYNNNYYGPNTPNICWVYNSQAFYQINILLSWQQIYIYIMYYSIGIVTTIAYGDIIPRNPIQCIYTIFTFIMFTIVFGYVFTEIIRLLVDVYSYNFQRRYNHFQLIQQLKSQNVPLSTRIQVRAHTEEIDREEQFRNRQVEDKILNFLPADPLYGLLLVIYRDFLKKLQINFAEQHLFQKFKPIAQKSLFLQSFMKEIKEQRQYIGDVIYQEGQIQSQAEYGHCAYFYTKKQYKNAVLIGVGHMPTLKFGMISHEKKVAGSFQLKKALKMYGQIQFLNGQQRSHWAICQLNCVVFVASRNSLFSNYHLLTQQEKEVVFSKMEKAKQVECFICQKEHYFLNCPYTFATFDNLIQKDSKIRRNNQFHRQFRTRLKTESSWTIYKRICHQRLQVTKQYKDKLLMDRINQMIFLEEKLQHESAQTEQKKQFQLQQKIYQVEAIIQKVQNNEVQHFNKANEQLQFDKSFNFKHYRVHNNISEIQRQMSHPSQRKANLQDIVQSSLIKLFSF